MGSGDSSEHDRPESISVQKAREVRYGVDRTADMACFTVSLVMSPFEVMFSINWALVCPLDRQAILLYLRKRKGLLAGPTVLSDEFSKGESI